MTMKYIHILHQHLCVSLCKIISGMVKYSKKEIFYTVVKFQNFNSTDLLFVNIVTKDSGRARVAPWTRGTRSRSQVKGQRSRRTCTWFVPVVT